MQVVLASASPRRQELLRELVSDFLVAPADVDEDALTTPDPFQTAELLAKEKAKAVAASYPGTIVIGGDTVVALPIKAPPHSEGEGLGWGGTRPKSSGNPESPSPLRGGGVGEGGHSLEIEAVDPGDRAPKHSESALRPPAPLPPGEGGEKYIQLTKPVDVEDAVRILLTLQGNEHLVITGISLQGPGINHTFHDVTRVRFREVNEDEIRAYVATGEPMDKAGAYGAQGMASTFVQSLDGSFKNVVGLPVERIRMELQSLGIRLDS